MPRLSISAAVIAVVLAASANAAPVVYHQPVSPMGTQVSTTVVTYADLDLSQPEGAAELYRRIKLASLAVCDDSQQRLRTTDMPRKKEACRKKAIADAIAHINAPLLTQVAAAQ